MPGQYLVNATFPNLPRTGEAHRYDPEARL